jgi:flagellar basal body rod protein FlgC
MSLDLLESAASGMDAQRAALDVAARNVAAAEAAGPNAEYAREIADFSVVKDDDGEALVRFAGTHRERGINVDILTEMIAVMNASRAYESNASLFDTGKQLAEKTIELGRV